MFDRYDATIDIYNKSAEPRLKKSVLAFKIILLVSNLIFVIFSFILIGLSSYALNSQANALTGQTLPGGIIAMAVFMLVLAIIGACSAAKESRAGLAIYLIFLLVITIILFSIGIAVVVKKDEAAKYIEEGWSYASPDVRNAIQTNFGCCGLKIVGENAGGADQTRCPDPQYMPVPTPCEPLLLADFKKYYNRAGGCGIAFAVLMAVVMLLVCFLMKGIKQFQQEKAAHSKQQLDAQEALDYADAAYAEEEEGSSEEEEEASEDDKQ
jgi:signal transduction histidine kinase